MRNIVIIEDNAVVARLYENKLRAAGNKVSVAMDGEEGLKLIQDAKPDLVLLDLLLPNLSGVEIIRRIRQDHRFSNLPIMAYSAADEDVLDQAIDAGTTTIISKKSASFKEILDQFNELMEMSRHWQIYNPAAFYDEPQGNGNSHATTQKQILIVEDDPITARVISDIAEKDNLHPVVIGDGQEAYRLLSSEANFAAAVLDVELPKIKGTDLLKYMRSEKRLRSIPVAVMTASSDYVRLQLESHEAGATFFLSKPFERPVFESLLKTMIKQ